MKVAIALPHISEKIDTRFVDSLVGLVAKSLQEGIEIVRIVTFREPITFARNRISSKALKHGVDYVLFLDDDMVFEPDLLINLIKCDKDIVGGLTFMRREPHEPSVYMISSDRRTYVPIYLWKPKEIIECDAIGMAATLVKGSVFDKMKKISLVYKDIWGFFDNENFTGEDLRFCQKSRELGYKIYCDTSQLVGHITDKIIGYGDYYALTDDKIYNLKKEQGIKNYNKEAKNEKK
jgi:glycosyltransferase involved in cell wall biosynthesis